MKVILLNETGNVDKLIHGDIEKPTLKEGEVLVKTKALSIDPIDVVCRTNVEFLNRLFGKERPVILGWDFSGEIVEKNNAEKFNVGDSVFGMLEFMVAGAYAEYIAVPEHLLALKPKNVSHEQAAATTLAAATAWQPLMHETTINEGDKVLIHGGSGGVGHFAVQFAKHLGAEVTATSSGKNRDFVLSLGADRHIDYKTQKFYEEVNDMDFVLDTVGSDTLTHSIDIVKKGGKIITLSPGLTDEQKEKAKQKGVDLQFMESHASGEDMESFAQLLEEGSVKPHISESYTFSEMGKAHQQVETGHTVGKVVLTF